MRAMPSNGARIARFATIGVINTVLDFGILIALKSFGVPVVPANIVSTSVALSFSFFANRKYTFNGTGGNVRRQIVSFLIVTLIGLWVIQNIIILGVDVLIQPLHLQATVALVVAKLIASVASLTWNYLLYSRFVFKEQPPQEA